MHLNGALLDLVEAVLGYAETIQRKGEYPEVVPVQPMYK
jgi:hypothetical protein